MTIRCLLSLALCVVCLGPPLRAQAVPDPDVQAHAARALREWVDDFGRGRLGPNGLLRGGASHQPLYVAAARRAGVLAARDEDRLTHLDVLQKLLWIAESQPSTELGDAVLGLCAVGFESSFLDQDALQLRELGHWALLRVEHQGTWFLLLRAAAGDQVPVFADLRTGAAVEANVVVGPARRVAALRLLGTKGLPVFRSTIEGALFDREPRVRLAAAEALEFQRRPEGLATIVKALPHERHPVVSQALVRVLLLLLRTHGATLDPGAVDAALRAAAQQFGQCGWRTDMDLLTLVETFPRKAFVPRLIDLLDRGVARDPLLDVVNRRASPLLRERCWTLLRAMTGALIAPEDAAGWRRFWAAEQDKVVVPRTLHRERAGATRSEFFGLPVTGASIAFLIDTSGSMEAAVAGTAGSESRARRAPTRLRAAKEQLTAAVHAMDPESTYAVVTFADRAHVWTAKPVHPNATTTRSLTELLSRLQPHGGTNLFAGLVEVLDLGRLGYGQEAAVRFDELFVLSDGQPTAGDVQDADTMLSLVREANKYAKVRIHCVFTGTGEAPELLRRLAAENDGQFVQR
jgi:hypothetical protein